MYIDESSVHAEYGSDGNAKNRSTTGRLSRQCQKHSEGNTASSSTAQLQETVSLLTASDFRNILSFILIFKQFILNLYYVICLGVETDFGRQSRQPVTAVNLRT